MTNPRDNWETPPALFDAVSKRWGPFDVDVCATDNNTKLPIYFGQGAKPHWEEGKEQTDGLAADWSGLRCWCNPPFSNWELWVAKAAERKAVRTVCLLPADTSTRRFVNSCCLDADLIIFLIGKRIAFIPPPEIYASSNERGNILAIFTSYASKATNAPTTLYKHVVEKRTLYWDWSRDA